MRSSTRYRRTSALFLAAGLLLTGAACSDDDSGDKAADAGAASGGGTGAAEGKKVSLTVNCKPPRTAEVDRKQWEQDVAAFEKLNPNIKIESKDAFPCSDPTTFEAKLSGNQMEDLFYVNYTNVQTVLARGAAADITPYAEKVLKDKEIRPDLVKFFQDGSGKTFGIPRTNYSMGLVYNRALFAKAGLDPAKPPATWDEVRAAAKKIADLGNNTVGYADYSASNQGGWHFVAELYSRGGQAVSADGKTATVDTAEGRAVLQTLHDMRWTDNSMGSKQLLTINDVQQMMGSGRLGMYLAAPDNITQIVNEFGGKLADVGMGPMPDGKGTLAGGDGYMFNKKCTPEQIEAGLKWLEFLALTPGKGLNDWARGKQDKEPVGLPEPAIWTGAAAKSNDDLKAQNATLPVENYQAFVAATGKVPAIAEPVQAQQIYSVLDGVVSSVLTKKDADIAKLLSEANGKITQVLGKS
ncbi:ABC transporter substrate-binding protein [Yinghuangia soli]|uniref:Sugar ABC transporter substrate-binding protein n=1 Tax=Yinghuangia soli TaxID=2908204 RepID=A0AA41PZJ2_9ACTN|nr:sugar ABC transporter substrate-binding protein [Yinghuangia soli]MCF2528006.1 sugar ABC transporter substrate-binding protein [Yinghuangia soli]